MKAGRAFDADRDLQQQAFDPIGLGGLTWLGLVVAGAGWALLLGEIGIADFVAGRVGRPVASLPHGDLVDIAKCLIGSGFGLAVIGGLRTGFGALNRFFAAVLARSGQRSSPSVVQPPASAAASEAEPEAVRPHRPYRILADGSVEVETIVGTRRFHNMDEARDFV